MNEGKIFVGPTITQPPPPISQFHHDGTIITASSNMSVVGEDQYSSNSDIDDSLHIGDDLCDVDTLFGGNDSVVQDWSFLTRSANNKYIDVCVLERDKFRLEYNSTDKWLLEQADTEIKHVLYVQTVSCESWSH